MTRCPACYQTNSVNTLKAQTIPKTLINNEYLQRLIIGSDQRSETKQGKIVRFRSCIRHFQFIISCRHHFVPFVFNFIHVNTEKRTDLMFVNECTG